MNTNAEQQPFSWPGAFFIALNVLLYLFVLAGLVMSVIDGAWGYSGLFLVLTIVWGRDIYRLTGKPFVRQQPREG